MSIVYEDLPVIHGTGEILSDSKTDWRKFKLKSEAVSHAMTHGLTRGFEQFLEGQDEGIYYWLRRSGRMFECGSELMFAVDNQGNMRLTHARFCKDRLCPSCQKRRSLAVFHQVKSICQSIQQDHPTMRYLMLTLTVPNVHADRLSAEIGHMMTSFKKLANRAEVKKGIRGYFRAMEVTYNSDRDDYHPHFHVLLAVPSGYFKKNYIKQQRWLELWRESTKYPEITQVDIRPIKPNPKRGSTEIESAAAEVGKYATKPQNYISETPDGDFKAVPKVIKDLALGIKSKRLIGFGGVFKDHRAKLELEDIEGDEIDLVNVGDDSDQIDAVMNQVFRWHVGLREYIN